MIRLLAAIGLTACMTASSAAAESNKQPWNDLLKPYDAKTKPAVPVTPPPAAVPDGESSSKTIAAETANVGEEVEISSSAILCSKQTDAAVLYLAGDMAWRQAKRVEGYLGYRIISIRNNARKQAMGSLHSCEWAPHDLRYHVDQKRITDSAVSVSYCLRPIVNGVSRCWWLTEDVAPPFKDVKRPVELDGKVGESQ